MSINEGETIKEKLNGRILVVDDNAVNRNLILRILARYKMTADIVSTPSEAISIFAPGRYDVALFDVDLESDIDGIELAQKLTATDPYLKVIFMSADHLSQEKAKEAKFGIFVPKPFTSVELLRPLFEALGLEFED